jgi:hypothetical protein
MILLVFNGRMRMVKYCTTRYHWYLMENGNGKIGEHTTTTIEMDGNGEVLHNKMSLVFNGRMGMVRLENALQRP